jgi:hypothetical protein
MKLWLLSLFLWAVIDHLPPNSTFMKVVYTLAICALGFNASAQDFCKQVRKEISDDKTQTDYSSPTAASGVTPIVVRRSINTNPEFQNDNFTVFFQVPGTIESLYVPTSDGGQREKDEKKIIIEFEDNTKFTDDTLQVNHDFTEDRTVAIRNLYMPVAGDAAKHFSSKKITKFSLAGFERTVPADTANAIMHYFQCIHDKK